MFSVVKVIICCVSLVAATVPPSDSPTGSQTPHLIYGPSNSPTSSITPYSPQNPNAPHRLSPHIDADPSFFCYAGLPLQLLQLYSLQFSGWYSLSDFAQFLGVAQSGPYSNPNFRAKVQSIYQSLRSRPVLPYDVKPFALPAIPEQTRFSYTGAFITLSVGDWPTTLDNMLFALSYDTSTGRYNYTIDYYSALYYRSISEAIDLFSSGTGVYDQNLFELSPPSSPSIPIVWVLFEPLSGCNVPIVNRPARPLAQKFPVNPTFSALICKLHGICHHTTQTSPGNCFSSLSKCCCIDNYVCQRPDVDTFSSCVFFDDDECCVENSTPASCPDGVFAISADTCFSFFSSDSITPSPSSTSSTTSSASRSPSLSLSPTSSHSLSASSTKSPSVSLSPTRSLSSRSPTRSPSLSNTPSISRPSRSVTPSVTLLDGCVNTCCCRDPRTQICYDPPGIISCNVTSTPRTCSLDCPGDFGCAFSFECGLSPLPSALFSPSPSSSIGATPTRTRTPATHTPTSSNSLTRTQTPSFTSTPSRSASQSPLILN
jgi:hypothetical protein